MFRYDRFSEVMDEYFDLTTKSLGKKGDGLVLGNVQLAEDRFPPVLLSFDEKTTQKSASSNRQAVGFVHDADFYFEAEKPLQFLMKQRRRWINGSYFACYWVLRESWIGNANQSWAMKMAVRCLLSLELIQGAILRVLGPAIAACGVAFMCVITPYLLKRDIGFIQKLLDNTQTPDLLFALFTAGLYMLFYAFFMVRHTPRAVPVKNCSSSSPMRWRSDHRSGYRPRLFVLSLIINILLSIWFTIVGVALAVTIGWKDMPSYFQAITIALALPYVVAFWDGLVNSQQPNLASFGRLVFASPVFILGSIWFYVWIPSYATARVSDLSWGNRTGTLEEATESEVAKRRANIGKLVSWSLVLCNVTLVAFAVGVKNVAKSLINYLLLPLLGMNILLGLLNLAVIFYRLCTKIGNITYSSATTLMQVMTQHSLQNNSTSSESGDSIDAASF
jgi:hypothetical protein